MSEPITHTLEAPGAKLTYDIRPTDSSAEPVLLLVGSPMGACTHHDHDFDALRQASTRIVLAAGAESEGEMANRGAHGIAERLGRTAEIFPSNHGGFLGGEYGQTGDPDAFAVKLREILADQG